LILEVNTPKWISGKIERIPMDRAQDSTRIEFQAIELN
jgi:hypothetical protein